MQAIENDTLKPASKFKTFEMLDVEVPRALIDYKEGRHIHPHKVEVRLDRTTPHLGVYLTYVKKVLAHAILF